MFLYSYKSINHFKNEDIDLLLKIAHMFSLFMKEAEIYSQKVFLSNISHEIKTPLAMISGYAELLQDKTSNNLEKSEEFLSSIIDNVNRANSIINNLLYISKIEEDVAKGQIEMELCPINDIIENVIFQSFEKSNEKKVYIIFNQENIYNTKVNAILLEQAILNLVNNSIKYCKNNTAIEIKLIEDEEYYVIEVHDESEGIHEDHINNLFERFYRTDKSRGRQTGGTGLGLAIVKLIAEAHGGKVNVKSWLDKGSIFSIHLPKNYN